MISYAQNREDVVLARALGGTERGFYIDVGAFHPLHDSVTRHFYERGWHGINVEPVPGLVEDFAKERARDLNIAAGVLDQAGETEFWECTANPGASTFDRSLVCPSNGTWRRHVVPVTTLALLCEEFVGSQQIDFLKIDTEGTEWRVLRGADWERWRPLVVVVEATRPHSSVQSHQAWEQVLLDAGYVHALFDGLNRFYARAEEPALLDLLSRPACVFDDYQTNESVLLRAQLDQTSEYAIGLEANLRAAQARLQDLDHKSVPRGRVLRRVARIGRRLRD